MQQLEGITSIDARILGGVVNERRGPDLNRLTPDLLTGSTPVHQFIGLQIVFWKIGTLPMPQEIVRRR